VVKTPLTVYQKHKLRWKDCERCSLCKERKQVTFLRGDIPAEILFIGEGPGEFEDSEGRPFIGPAGNLLTRCIRSAERISRVKATTCFVNVVGCIPKIDGQKLEIPYLEHVEACLDKVKESVDIVKPNLIVTVGRVAGDWIPDNFEEFKTSKRIHHIVHPASILKAPNWQKPEAVERLTEKISYILYNLVPF
jgi:uracil-DNA glycosylase family 4